MKRERYRISIFYINGSFESLPFNSFMEARDKYQNGISYTGGRVKRVEVKDMLADSTRAIWDISWDAISQAAGLRDSL